MRLFVVPAVLVALATVSPALAAPKNCPPGLAKKPVACVPPGQAKKAPYRYGKGARIDDYIVVRDPGRYGLDPSGTYYRSGDYLYRMNRETREVIALIGAVADILN